ncbi:hypothetical protein OIU84_004585 [Salix udensis]|uniref:Uncharacterized protein n=1 Tax=Salix udensis TaxID=889485 RepID=A0AAD6K4N4_9ROSI|nr:hypothetical protein OIU84_004585 [Salix udensis]
MLSLFGLGISWWIIALFVETISWIFALSAKQIKLVLQARSALLPGVCALLLSRV